MRLILAVVFTLVSISPALGQETQVVPFGNYFEGLSNVKSAEGLTIIRGERELTNRMIVEVPGSALTMNHGFRMISDEKSSLHMMVLEQTPTVTIRDTDGTTKVKATSLRIHYNCDETDAVACGIIFRAMLESGLQMQSFGVPNLEGLSALPEGDLVFSFYVNRIGKFR